MAWRAISTASAARAASARRSTPRPCRSPIVSPALCAAIGADPLALALGGGEDYVLLFTLPEQAAPPPEMRARRIGRITKGSGVVLLRGGERSDLPALGWDHLSGSTSVL